MIHDQYAINRYSATVEMRTHGEQDSYHAVAMERQAWWFNDVMQNCLLIDYGHHQLESFYQTGQRVVVLPYAPVDHVVLIMLFCKLNAIMGGHLIVDEIHLSSDLGSGVVYSHGSEDVLLDFDSDGWWCENHAIWANLPGPSDDRVIALDRSPNWHDLGLSWDQEPCDSQVVDFRHDKK